MANRSNVFAYVEPEIKDQADRILESLGISMSDAIGMFLRQVVLRQGIPFEVKQPKEIPLAYASLTKEQFDAEIGRGGDDAKSGNTYSAAAVETEMRGDYGI